MKIWLYSDFDPKKREDVEACISEAKRLGVDIFHVFNLCESVRSDDTYESWLKRQKNTEEVMKHM